MDGRCGPVWKVLECDLRCGPNRSSLNKKKKLLLVIETVPRADR